MMSRNELLDVTNSVTNRVTPADRSVAKEAEIPHCIAFKRSSPAWIVGTLWGNQFGHLQI